ncbi:MAG: nuclear transport factor 2 family protein [Kastovskya adunca ATA6-11-RM4]|jgi:hypothetical protein|nr:nuclear transport factor 2 family protein [Kastovskya adunca ATA6-11-RM4]
MTEQTLNSLIDHLQIIQLVNQFGFAIDMRDWEMFQSLFDHAVEFDYSSIQGPAGNLKPEQSYSR